jgi:threonine/homoserine/homoserine lactone efflux protein
MGQAISQILPYAIGVAISPVPIIAVILVLFSSRARTNGPIFLAGWIVGVGVLSVAVYLLADAGDVGSDQGASDTSYRVKLILGLLFLFLAVKQWRSRPRPGHPPADPPKWMASIDSLTPAKTGGLALLLSVVNPKNLVLCIGAGASLAEAGVSGGDAAVGLIVFIVLASASIGVPVIAYLVGGAKASTMLDGWKAWLGENNAAVMGVLFAVFGVVLFSQGLGGLTD